MSAFRRRTTFAAPLIITVAVGCSSGGKSTTDQTPKRYPGSTWHVTPRGQDCMASETDLGCPKGVMCNPPPPQEIKCPPFPEGREWARVVKRPSGECAVLPDGCLDDTCVGAATDCPLPFGESLSKPEQAP